MRHFPRHHVACWLLLLGCNAAYAQSNVAMYGVLDTFVTHIHADGLPSVTRLDTSSLLASRIGFRGREDLGGGASANFTLEIGLNGDDGTAPDANRFANRQAWVGLAGRVGEIRLGRQNTPQFVMNGKYDAFTSGTQASGWNNFLGAPPRADNAVGLFSEFHGVKVQALLARGATGGAAPLDERAANRNTHVAAEYAKDDVYLGANWQAVRTVALNATAKRTTVGASYRLNGAWTVYGSAGAERRTDGALNTRIAQVSAQYRFHPQASLSIGWAGLRDRVSGAGHGDASQLGLMGRYFLSTRTTLYGTLSRLAQQELRNSFFLSGAAVVSPGAQVRSPLPGGDIRGMQAGILHTF
ncbi:porin [Duganella sp. FT92W]|uniref:Porin n=1 Tax=Pseudoduganella rivuli TaxID=2666085 RepID=A0A7X2ISM4_9BURK|nr:porin [Pseudoduganella rivuli]MRV75357.1 porin [Pseudoduganella rivuli]